MNDARKILRPAEMEFPSYCKIIQQSGDIRQFRAHYPHPIKRGDIIEGKETRWDVRMAVKIDKDTYEGYAHLIK